MIEASWEILAQLAPWLFIGMAVAGALHGLLPKNFVRRHLGGRGGVGRAVMLGVPLPLCSCGVIPAGLGLKKDGASDGATVGFLISTPQTGVDSILVSASFLGWPFAIFKVLSAGITGLVGGWLANSVSDSESSTIDDGVHSDSGGRTLSDMVGHAVELLQSIWQWLIFGVVASAAIGEFVPDGFFEAISGYGGLVASLAVLAFSLPLYVCATASVPIAAALVLNGLPPGAALVFLMAGPASNMATIGAIYAGLGKRILVVYLGTIMVGSVALGMAADFVIDPEVIAQTMEHHHTSLIGHLSAVALLLFVAKFATDDTRRFFARRKTVDDAEPMSVVGIDGMTCSGCSGAVENVIRKLDGVSNVVVNLEPGQAVVHGSVDLKQIQSAIVAAGFEIRNDG
jgi:uncharacterized protein